MVQLTQIVEQYPWNPKAPEDWSDKEIYTHHVDPEDMEKVWTVPILPCMRDFAYVGYRIRTTTQAYPTRVRLITGDGRKKTIFGTNTDILQGGFDCVNWTRFKYPLPYKLLCLEEDEMCMEITFPDAIYGKVEFLAQKFDELEDDTRPLWFCENDFVDRGWILSPNQYFYKLDTLTKREEYPTAVTLYSLTLRPV